MAVDKVRDTSFRVEMPGLKELQRMLRAADPDAAKRLQQVNKKLVERIAAEAQSRFYKTTEEVGRARIGPVRQRPSRKGSIGRTRDSIRAQASGREAKVVAGGPKAEGFFGHEFGGGARPRTRQFPVHRGVDGYVFYPTLREKVKSAKDDWDAIFDEVFGRTGPL